MFDYSSTQQLVLLHKHNPYISSKPWSILPSSYPSSSPSSCWPLVLPLFLIFPSATRKKASICTGSALQQAVYGCSHLSLPILGAGSKHCAKQTSLCFSSECIGTDADTSEAQWMHNTCTSVSLTVLAINWCFFSTLNRVNNMDQKISSLSHRLNILAPLAYTFPAQIKGIITLFCGIHCNTLGL